MWITFSISLPVWFIKCVETCFAKATVRSLNAFCPHLNGIKFSKEWFLVPGVKEDLRNPKIFRLKKLIR